MLDVRRLQVLRAVVSSGSVTAAAANLGYTPSAVSQQLSTLEREAGTALLNKAGRGLRPTPAGRLLAQHAASLAATLADAESALADLRAGRTGKLSVIFFQTAGASLMPPALAAFRTIYPEVGLHLSLEDDMDASYRKVLDGEADLAVVVERQNAQPRRGLTLIPLAQDPFYAVLHEDHPLATRQSVRLALLADQPWIGCQDPGLCWTVVVEACAAAGFSPHLALDAGNYYNTQAFVGAGLGIGVLPGFALGALPKGVVIREIRDPEPVRDVFMAVRDGEQELPMISALSAALRRD
ncbi:LysR family transcriptional regulator [Pseudonocardiaceae bacterium YIM PH 21723]|nr:LysR family transcriptional regulator [Pseudonocardiaceae bacterium YIM PH 21723]